MARISLDLAHSYKPNPQQDGDYALLPLKMEFEDGGASVSYTHLTLPTSDLV